MSVGVRTVAPAGVGSLALPCLVREWLRFRAARDPRSLRSR
jgi:hypothetical protein